MHRRICWPVTVAVNPLTLSVPPKYRFSRLSAAKSQDCALPRVNGIKLDLENFDWHVLCGASQLLKRDHPVIYCELWDTPNRRKVVELRGIYGYKCEKQDTKEDFVFRYVNLRGKAGPRAKLSRCDSYESPKSKAVSEPTSASPLVPPFYRIWSMKL
jgi:hypothetical protein